MDARVDLHIHTYYSDGLSSPEEILKIVRDKDLIAFSICDHDNLGGYLSVRSLLDDGDPVLIPGVELSAGSENIDIHILGYYINPESDELKDALENFRDGRNRRGAEMLNKLKELGIDLSYDDVKKLAGKSAIGRPNVADALVKAGAVNSFGDAFARYIGYHGPAYVPKRNLTPKEAIDLIHRADGLAILAHPGLGGASKFMNEFVEFGLDGIEVYHPNHNSRVQRNYSDYAAKKSLLITGGSDYHGRDGRYADIGTVAVPEEIWKQLEKRAGN
jgi:predicted metal-dependent phosphoesterase TrpH